MKPMQQYKDAVMCRVEEKKRERRRTQKRLLAVCVPLCLCLVVAASFVPPLFSANLDGATEGTPMIEYPDFVNASIVSSDGERTVTDPERLAELYGVLYTLVTQTDNTSASYGGLLIGDVTAPETAEDPTDGADEEVNQNGTVNGWRICFETEDGVQAMFTLQGNRLYDALFDETQWLTEEQTEGLTEILLAITGG